MLKISCTWSRVTFLVRRLTLILVSRGDGLLCFLLGEEDLAVFRFPLPLTRLEETDLDDDVEDDEELECSSEELPDDEDELDEDEDPERFVTTFTSASLL